MPLKRRQLSHSVGRAVTLDTRGPQFESSHHKILYRIFILMLTVEKAKVNKKRPEMAHLETMM